MRCSRVFISLALLIAGGICMAQAGQAPVPAKAIALRAARIFDGRSDRVTSPGLVIVQDGKILRTGGDVPAGAEVIDLGDATLLPGFIDVHTHLTSQISDDWKQDELDALKKSVPERTLDALEHATKTLMSGFTTVRDLGSGDMIDVGLRNTIRNWKVPGPRMLVAVHAIGATGGHCDPTNGYAPGLFDKRATAEDTFVANGADAVRAAVRANIKYGADVVKVCASGGVLSLTDDVSSPQMTQAELDALVDEAHALKRKAAAHAHGAEAIKRAVRAGIDSIEHGTFADDEALDMMKARGTFFVPTLMASQGLKEAIDKGLYIPPLVKAKAQAAIAARDQTFKKVLVKGVRVALGTDAGVYPHGRNNEEFHTMVDLGMTPLDALRAGTSSAAELLGMADQIGTLEPGRLADVVAVPGNPLTEIWQTQHAFFVMKEGVVFKNQKQK
jgi:imidazolonepropionase-like amidohydrolase